mmetsp:Transcript_3084/g.4550  ORF Transcript_3084/g.4550 Transcript_3084/m.4550 type:complete len:202 (+) Transcript_3084:68-673(+)
MSFSMLKLRRILKTLLDSLQIQRRILVHHSFCCLTISSIFEARCVLLSPRTRSTPNHFKFDAQGIVARFDAEESHLAPVLAPGISDNPILSISFFSPSNNAHNMIDQPVQDFSISNNTSLIICKWKSVDACCNRPACKNFSFNFVHLITFKNTVTPIFRNSCIGKCINCYTLASHSSKCVTSSTCINGRASCVNVITQTLR